MLYEQLTGQILQACFEVSNELGAGYLESVYEKALLILSSSKWLKSRITSSVAGKISQRNRR